MADIRLHNVNCMDFMKGVPDKAYDLAIVDPPYGIKVAENGKVGGNKPFGKKENYGSKNSRKRIIESRDYGAKKWDNNIPDECYFSELKRVSKHQIIWGGNYFLSHLGPTSCMIVWDKDNSGNFADCEIAWTSFDTAVRKFKYRWNGMLQEVMGEFKQIRIHPTEKPVPLYKWLLNNYANPGDRILDTHGGSMSIAIACYDLGFDLDLCELDPDYFQAGQKRLDNHISKYAPAHEIPATKKGELKLF